MTNGERLIQLGLGSLEQQRDQVSTVFEIVRERLPSLRQSLVEAQKAQNNG